jgi:hypothetical protein
MDGDQVLDFYWIYPLEAAKRFISKPKFAGKLYTKYELHDLCSDQESEPLAGPIQGWFFNLHNSLTLSALHCYSCSMQTKHFLASKDPTIQSIVSFKKNLMRNMFKYI